MKDRRDIYIFLDIDGVVATNDSLFSELSRYFGKTEDEIKEMGIDELCDSTNLTYPDVCMYSWPFCQKAINNLYSLQRRIAEKDNVKWVLSSSWRIGRTVKEINRDMPPRGLRLDFIGKTDSKDGVRGLEIQRYIDEHKVKDYIIIDDEIHYDIKSYHPNNCVNTTFKEGFTEENIEEALKIISDGN